MDTKLQAVEKTFQEKSPTEIVQDEKVKNKFISLYQLIHGKGNGELFYRSESFHFLKQLSDKPELAKCEKLSLYGCFLDVAVNGLSFDPGMKQVYLVPFGNKCTLMISPYGELYLRIRSGQIKHADNPVLVFEGDYFKSGTRNGEGFVEHESVFPRKHDNVIACYVRIERPDGSVDYKVMGIDEIMKLKEFSAQKGSIAWTKGINGMIQAKTLKHAFRSYPRVRVRGTFSKIEEDEGNGNGDAPIDYSFGEDTPAVLSSANGKITPNQNVGGAPSPQARVAAATMTADESGGHTTGSEDDDLFDN